MSQLVDWGFCSVCYAPILESEKSILHHVSYFPERTVPVHTMCHASIHHRFEYPHLRPPYGHAKKFYDQFGVYEKKQMYDRMHPEKKQERAKREYQMNKERYNELASEYYQEHKDAHLKRAKKYNREHKEKISKKVNEYRENHKSEIKKQVKKISGRTQTANSKTTQGILSKTSR